MDTTQQQLLDEVQRGGNAYVRNLAAAEAAILRGQFNLAKVLRASAHAQRTLALNAARLVASEWEPSLLLQMIATELEQTTDKAETSSTVRAGLIELVRRSLASLNTNPDVLESDVAQSLWGCYSCGHISEGERPEFCSVCGALGVEFEWFGPFYSATPEHLGQLSPTDIVSVLAATPHELARALADTSDDELARKPSSDEWSAKEIVGHLIELDVLFIQRVKVVLESEGLPVIPRALPPWKLHEGKGYESRTIAELVERFRQGRERTLEMVGALKSQQWMRQGTVQGKATSLLDMGTWVGNHDRGHLAQIRRLCAVTS